MSGRIGLVLCRTYTWINEKQHQINGMGHLATCPHYYHQILFKARRRNRTSKPFICSFVVVVLVFEPMLYIIYIYIFKSDFRNKMNTYKITIHCVSHFWDFQAILCYCWCDHQKQKTSHQQKHKIIAWKSQKGYILFFIYIYHLYNI